MGPSYKEYRLYLTSDAEKLETSCPSSGGRGSRFEKSVKIWFYHLR